MKVHHGSVLYLSEQPWLLECITCPKVWIQRKQRRKSRLKQPMKNALTRKPKKLTPDCLVIKWIYRGSLLGALSLLILHHPFGKFLKRERSVAGWWLFACARDLASYALCLRGRGHNSSNPWSVYSSNVKSEIPSWLAASWNFWIINRQHLQGLSHV